MRPRTRLLVPLLIGVLATLTALLAGDFLRRDACLGAGGSWQAVERSCTLPTGAGRPWMAGSLAYLATAPLGLLAAVFLWRTYTFFASGRAVHRIPRA